MLGQSRCRPGTSPADSVAPARRVGGRGRLRPGGPAAEGGFALIAVLWLLVALSAIGVQAAMETRTERLAAANLLDRTRSREIALAGAEYARSRLTAAMLDRADELRAEAASRQRQTRGGGARSRTLSVDALFSRSSPADDPWRAPYELVEPEQRFGDAVFTLEVRDAEAALNLNGADAEMLLNFFSQGLGLDYALSDRLAQAILDWTDADDLPRVGGAERDDYIKAGAPVLPPNRPFGHIDELRYVAGMTPEIFEAAAPYLTLNSSGQVNVNAAPAPVLLALPGMTPPIVEEIERLRDSGVYPVSSQQLLGMLSPAARGQLTAIGRRLTGRMGFRTDQVEIISRGRVEGSGVESTVRIVVARATDGATVVMRDID